MDTITLPSYLKSLAAREDAKPKIYGLQRLSPNLQSNAFAQSVQISANMAAKAQQLVDLLETSSGTFPQALTVDDFRAQIEENGLEETLNQYLNLTVDGVSPDLRGQRSDATI